MGGPHRIVRHRAALPVLDVAVIVDQLADLTQYLDQVRQRGHLRSPWLAGHPYRPIGPRSTAKGPLSRCMTERAAPGVGTSLIEVRDAFLRIVFGDAQIAAFGPIHVPRDA